MINLLFHHQGRHFKAYFDFHFHSKKWSTKCARSPKTKSSTHSHKSVPSSCAWYPIRRSTTRPSTRQALHESQPILRHRSTETNRSSSTHQRRQPHQVGFHGHLHFCLITITMRRQPMERCRYGSVTWILRCVQAHHRDVIRLLARHRHQKTSITLQIYNKISHQDDLLLCNAKTRVTVMEIQRCMMLVQNYIITIVKLFKKK